MNATCPECRAGKCRNCDGNAWDFERDDFTPCACWESDHRWMRFEGDHE